MEESNGELSDHDEVAALLIAIEASMGELVAMLKAIPVEPVATKPITVPESTSVEVVIGPEPSSIKGITAPSKIVPTIANPLEKVKN